MHFMSVEDLIFNPVFFAFLQFFAIVSCKINWNGNIPFFSQYKVQMWPARVARKAGASNDLAAFNSFTFGNEYTLWLQMNVCRDRAIGMHDQDPVAFIEQLGASLFGIPVYRLYYNTIPCSEHRITYL